MFVHDRQTGNHERVSVGSTGSQGDRVSLAPAISADGRFVAFASRAANLVARRHQRRRRLRPRPPDRHDRARSSVDSAGTRGNGASVQSRDQRRRPLRRLRLGRHQPRARRHQRRQPTSSSTTARPAPPSASASTAPGQARRARELEPPLSADGRFVAFHPTPRTSSRATRTAPTTSSCATGRPAPSSGSASTSSGDPGERRQRRPVDQRRRPLRRLHSFASNLVPGDTNCARRLRPRPPDRRHELISMDLSGDPRARVRT